MDLHSPLEMIPLNKREQDIFDGILFCESCGRWFPIRKGIPHLARDGLRRQEEDLVFLSLHKEKLPPRITETGIPLNLAGGKVRYSSEDLHCQSEGDFWSRFIEAHYAVGDTSILDVRSRSTHPSFYNLGVLERDDKDRNRRYGMWPDHLSRVIYGFLESLEPGRALDVGCGGGQFGLEAAYQGWEVVAMDVALGALEVGRDYASKIGQTVHYIYAEPSNPPFREGVFDLLMAKDSLHHFSRLDKVFPSLHRLLEDNGRFLFFEHVGLSPVARWIKNRANRCLHPKIQRRYPRVEIPEILRQGAPCEDIGREEILGLTNRYFHVRKSVKELMLYHELEFSIHYAFGKRMWFTRPVTWFIRWFMEKPLLLFQKPEFAVLLGDKRILEK